MTPTKLLTSLQEKLESKHVYGSSFPLNSPHNALHSAANVTDLLVPPRHMKYCVTHSSGVVVPKCLCSEQAVRERKPMAI